ncbi:MAG: hypothetical protein WBG19_08050 [Thermoplasmata archaeon]
MKAVRRELVAELARLEREEEYLRLKVRQAREQVRYYDGLLTLLRRDWGRAPGLSELVRKLG